MMLSLRVRNVREYSRFVSLQLIFASGLNPSNSHRQVTAPKSYPRNDPICTMEQPKGVAGPMFSASIPHNRDTEASEALEHGSGVEGYV